MTVQQPPQINYYSTVYTIIKLFLILTFIALLCHFRMCQSFKTTLL